VNRSQQDKLLMRMDALMKERSEIFDREGDKSLRYLEVTKRYHRAKEAWLKSRLEAA
jgi:hypothetical protein